jgi:hypothetical protein
MPLLAAWLMLLVACGSDPTQVLPQAVVAFVAGGDSQYGTPGQELSTPLHVVVQSQTTELPVRGRNVAWEIEAGDAEISGPALAVTDSTGSARAQVRLGSTIGEVSVRAQVLGEGGGSVLFRLFTVDRPVLNPLGVVGAAPGGSIELTGENFSPDPEQNVVLFSGIRGRVTSASGTALSVTVPPCLPARSVAVSVQLGTLASPSRELVIESGGEVLSLAVGEVFDALDPQGYSCATLPGDGSAEYVVIAQAAGSIGAATYPIGLFGLGSPATVAAPTSIELAAARYAVDRSRVGGQLPDDWWRQPFARSAGRSDDVQSLWDQRLRALEQDLATSAARPAAEPAGPASAPAAAPAVGERRTFKVFRNPGDFTDVTAVARVVGQRAALFVDETAPAGGYSEADLQFFSDMFDDAIEPTVTGAYGETSDLDSNDRIIILFTPAVNELTPRGVSGFIAGFFFGVDLLPGEFGSNEGEIFYTLVPDPGGQFSDPRPKSALLEVAPAVLGHEFQHMVNFNERVLTLGAEGNEAVWLSEALAQYAEELVARWYADRGDVVATERFRGGVRSRSRRYLARPDTVSLIVSYGQGSLAERGGGFLFATYLADRFGSDVIGRLTKTTRTGVTNVEAETGSDWSILLSDWWAASWLDGLGIASGVLEYPTVDLRGFLGDPYPLLPTSLGGGDFSLSRSMPSSSAGYYIVTPEAGGTTTLRLGGEAGGASLPQAEAQMRILRVR